MIIYFVRHAKTVDDMNKVTQNDNSEIFRDIDTSLKIRELKKIKVDKTYSSAMERGIQTAEMITDNFIIKKYLNEYRQPKLFEKMTTHQRMEWWKKHPEHTTDPDWSYDNSESFNQINSRAKLVLMNIRKMKYQKIMVITHATILKHILLTIMKPSYTISDFHLIRKLYLQNLEYVKVEIGGGD